MKLILQAVKSLLGRLNSRIDTLISDTAAEIDAIDKKVDGAVDTAEALNSKVSSNEARLNAFDNAIHTRNRIIITADGANAEGTGCIAAGYRCVAVGNGTAAFGYSSSARGNGQTAIGKYNSTDTEEKYAFIVGNGIGNVPESRSNAHTLDWSGNGWFAGTVEGTALILSSPSGKRFKITVADDGTLTTTEVT